MTEPILCTGTELARVRGIDRRSLRNLPPVAARLLAGKRYLPLYLLRDELEQIEQPATAIAKVN